MVRILQAYETNLVTAIIHVNGIQLIFRDSHQSVEKFTC